MAQTVFSRLDNTGTCEKKIIFKQAGPIISQSIRTTLGKVILYRTYVHLLCHAIEESLCLSESLFFTVHMLKPDVKVIKEKFALILLCLQTNLL